MNNLVQAQPRQSLIATFAAKYGIEPERMLSTLKATAFKTDAPITNEQMAALLIVANEYNLNPFLREIFAFVDTKRGGAVVPFISVDGWARIINEHPMFDGMGFDTAADGASCLCTMYRKDRTHPVAITEYLAECRRNTAPWQSHPRRMLRHKAMIQCARIAFGFAGIHDEAEARDIVVNAPPELVERVAEPEPAGTESKTYARLLRALRACTQVVDADLVIDEARHLLTEEAQEQLLADASPPAPELPPQQPTEEATGP